MTATQSPAASSGNKRRTTRIVALAALLVVVAIGAFLWWFFQDDAPDEVSLEGAAAQVVDDTATEPETTVPVTTAAAATTDPVATTDPAAPTTAAPATTAPAAPTTTAAAGSDLSGTWNVDTTIGEFSYEDSTGTFVGFRVAEELSGIGAVDAVGRTPVVSGSITLDGSTLTAVAIEADMSAITTDDGRRDDKVWEALDTATHPTATFVLSSPVELGEAALAGEPVSVDAPGELTIKGVTQSVTFPLQAQLVGDTIVVVGSLEIVFADYGVSVPTAPIVLSAEDNGPIELQLFFTR